ncbi:MAG TPA: CHASE3 domain-containing protein [Pseudonocardiaceae bacterium]|nr:CHASE3 domain-containing protein [Pseudonocardiaceae bacterium]
MSGGLTRRMVVASGLLALVVGAAFAVLLLSVADLRESAQLARHSEEVLATANQLERLVVDLETGGRGFVITGQERFLQPWEAAQATLPDVSSRLEQLTVVAVQHRRAEQIAQAAASYLRDYSLPLVATARRDPASARTVAVTDEGTRRVDAMRAEFDRLVATERDLSAARQERANAAAARASIASVGGLAGSVLLIALFAGYLTRAIVGPVRRTAAMAGRLACGDLAARMPETGVGEIGTLERSFNSMAGSLQQSRGELARLAEEQAALRRVATQVAHGVPPADLFAAVVEELGRLLPADLAHMARYEPDNTVTEVAAWAASGDDLPVSAPQRLEGRSVSALVWRTGRPVRMDSYAEAIGPIADAFQALGIRSSVGCPIPVEGRLWGVMIASSKQSKPLPASTESRMADFTELVATAIANANSRAELATSRKRIVAAADQTRRRIERDLHDGVQQRLVSLGLDLRATQAAPPAEPAELRAELAVLADGLGDALGQLRELSRGIHPAILSEGGLGPALKALARRSAVPVELDVPMGARLPEPVEVAAYYVASEALTNTAKHARASVVFVDVHIAKGRLDLTVRDDGIGGAGPGSGSGLVGLIDRVQALGGTITIHSPKGEGTTLQVELPISLEGG